jgi:hypothetical protein
MRMISQPGTLEKVEEDIPEPEGEEKMKNC